jgi:hypothetical protein
LYCHLARIFLQFTQQRSCHAICFFYCKISFRKCLCKLAIKWNMPKLGSTLLWKIRTLFFLVVGLPGPELEKLLFSFLRTYGYTCSWNVNVQFENNTTIIMIKTIFCPGLLKWSVLSSFYFYQPWILFRKWTVSGKQTPLKLLSQLMAFNVPQMFPSNEEFHLQAHNTV